MLRDADIAIHLNSDAFTLADSQELEERLRSETDLRIESNIAAYSGVVGEPPPPDVVIYLLNTIAPIAASVFLNVLSNAIWDAMKAARPRQEKEDPEEKTLSIVRSDEKGKTISEVSGQPRDRESTKELLRRVLEDDEG